MQEEQCWTDKAGEHNDMAMRVQGHWLLCQKLRVDDIRAPDGKVLLFRPEKSKEEGTWVEILAVGSQVGEPYVEKLPHGKKRTVRPANQFAKGDFILCPKGEQGHEKIQRTTFCSFQHFIHESVPYCIIKKEDIT